MQHKQHKKIFSVSAKIWTRISRMNDRCISKLCHATTLLSTFFLSFDIFIFSICLSFSCPSFFYISHSIFFHFYLFSFPSIVPFYLFSFLSVFLFESSISSLIQMTCKIKKFHSLTRLTWFFCNESSESGFAENYTKYVTTFLELFSKWRGVRRLQWTKSVL